MQEVVIDFSELNTNTRLKSSSSSQSESPKNRGDFTGISQFLAGISGPSAGVLYWSSVFQPEISCC